MHFITTGSIQHEHASLSIVLRMMTFENVVPRIYMGAGLKSSNAKMSDSANSERCPPDSSDRESFQQSPNPTYIYTRRKFGYKHVCIYVYMCICMSFQQSPKPTVIYVIYKYMCVSKYLFTFMTSPSSTVPPSGGSSLARALGSSVWKMEEKSRFTCIYKEKSCSPSCVSINQTSCSCVYENMLAATRFTCIHTHAVAIHLYIYTQGLFWNV